MTARHPGTRSLRRAGVVLPAVLVLVFTTCLVVALVTRFSVRSMRLARRTLDVQRALVPRTRQPNAVRMPAVCRPIFPVPTMPTVFPASSLAPMPALVPPRRAAASWAGRFLRRESIMPTASSETARVE